MKFLEGEWWWWFQAYWFDYQVQEYSVWVWVLQNQLLFNLVFMGDLEFEEFLGKFCMFFVVIFYINILGQQDGVVGILDVFFKIGGDVKLFIGNGMNLDIIVNLDFFNVEVDVIFINLICFEVLLLECWQFFIDNSDLFNFYGSIYNDVLFFFFCCIGLAWDMVGNFI